MRETRNPRPKGAPLGGSCLPLLETLVDRIISHRDWCLREVIRVEGHPKQRMRHSLLCGFQYSQLVQTPFRMLACGLANINDHIECSDVDRCAQSSMGEAKPVKKNMTPVCMQVCIPVYIGVQHWLTHLWVLAEQV